MAPKDVNKDMETRHVQSMNNFNSFLLADPTFRP